MRTHTELVRLAEARPAVVSRSEQVVDAVEEDLILKQVLNSSDRSTESVDVTSIMRRHHSSSRFAVCAIAGVAAAMLVVVGTGSLTGEGPRSPGTSRTQGSSSSTSSVPSTGATVVLAGYRFKLPAGFKAVDSPCAPMPPSIPMEGSDPFAAAGTADGGCIEVGLTAGAISGGPEPVEVGPYQGFLSSDGTTSVTLYVEMPTAAGKQYLLLTATGLSPNQVIAIAKAGLPSSITPVPPCTSDCG